MIAVIKTQAHYDEALARVSQLVELDPPADSAEGRELELLAVLLQDYERKSHALGNVSPVAAIQMRMTQLGLAPKDLAPILGSRSRVSEVLSGKRSLSLNMIRELHKALSIPLEVLVAEIASAPSDEGIEWERVPLREMLRRGWIRTERKRNTTFTRERAREVLEPWMLQGSRFHQVSSALHKTDRVRKAPTSDFYALAAWTNHVRRRAEGVEPVRAFRRSDWNADSLKELRGLSRFDEGPRLAVRFLEERGVLVDFVPQLPRTRLDGAALLREDGVPLIAMTLRLDRLDNFWFTLFHELMHVLLHLRGVESVESDQVFLDELDVVTEISRAEQEADDRAREALVPSSAWNSSACRFVASAPTVRMLALDVGVADAVVAGRARWEQKSSRILSGMVGNGRVRTLFPEVHWTTSE